MDRTHLTRRGALLAGAGALSTLALGGGALGLSAPATAASWPTRRGDPAEIRRRFGARAELVARSLTKGDPLADAVVAELGRLGPAGRATLQAGIKNGLASLSGPPPAIAAFLRQTESIPPWSSQRALEQGSRNFLTVYPAAHAVTLALRSLVHTYSAPSIAGVLVGTYELIGKTKQRLLETTDWLVRCMLPGGLARGGDGYVATLQVRLLHAQSRARALQGGWDTAAWGTPISQVDLARTWCDFTILSYPALHKLGYDFTSAELADVYRMWWHIGHLLGIDPAFYQGITGHEQAQHLLDLVDATNEPPDGNSRALVKATVAATAQLIVDWVRLPRHLATDGAHASFRFLNGDRLAREFDIPPTLASAALPPAVVASVGLRGLQRVLPTAWDQMIRQNEKDLRHFLAEQPPAAYATKTARLALLA